MQRINVDDDDDSTLSSLRLTLNLDDVPPNEESLAEVDPERWAAAGGAADVAPEDEESRCHSPGPSLLSLAGSNLLPNAITPKPELRTPKPETRNPKPETRNPKPARRLQRLEHLLQAIRDPNVTQLSRVSADYLPKLDARGQSVSQNEEISLVKDQLIQVPIETL